MVRINWWEQACFAPADTEKGGAVATDDADDVVTEHGSSRPQRPRSENNRAGDGEDDDSDDEESTESGRDADDSHTDTETDADESAEASLVEYLRGMGYQPQGKNDEEALRNLVEQSRANEQRWQQAEQQRQQLAAQYQQQQNWLLQQQQFAWHQQQQAAASQQQQQQRQLQGMLAHWNQVPEYSEQWLQFITTDEHGNPVVKPGGDPNLLQKIEQRKAWERQGIQSLLQNPVDFVGHAMFQNPVLHNYVQQVVSQHTAAVRAEFDQYRQQVTAEKLLNEIEPLLRADDGQSLTPFGQVYGQAVQELAGVIPDPQELHRQALKRAYPYIPSAGNGKSAAGQQTESSRSSGAEKRFKLLRQNATRNSGRGGTVASTGRKRPSQDSRLGLEDKLRRTFAAAGLQDDDFKRKPQSA